jgi:hypothetical protein
MRTLCLLTLLCTSASAAPVPKELKNQGSIVGKWKLESFTVRKANDKNPDKTE